MKFLVEAFDKQSNFQVFVIELPQGCDEQIKTIMGWTKEQQGWEGYDLSQKQLRAIEKLLDSPIEDPLYYFQITCNV